jgi:hypothetical protein
LKAYDQALKTREEKIARVKAKIWVDCADHFSKLRKDSKTASKDLCKSRWILLTNSGANDDTSSHDLGSETPLLITNASSTNVRPISERVRPLQPTNDGEENDGGSAFGEVRRLYGIDHNPFSGSDGRVVQAVNTLNARRAREESPTPDRREGRRRLDSTDPRSVMLVTEIDVELMNRGLNRQGPKAELLTRLNEDDYRSTEEMLRSRLSTRGLPTDGAKECLIQRLRDHDVANSDWGRMNAIVPHKDPRGQPNKRTRNVVDDQTLAKRNRGLAGHGLASSSQKITRRKTSS